MGMKRRLHWDARDLATNPMLKLGLSGIAKSAIPGGPAITLEIPRTEDEQAFIDYLNSIDESGSHDGY